MRTLHLLLTCPVFLLGCGGLGSPQDLDENGPGAPLTSSNPQPRDLSSGHPITLAEPERFTMERGQLHTFVVDIPPGEHAFALTLQDTAPVLQDREVRVAWFEREEGAGGDLEQELLRRLDGCSMMGREPRCDLKGSDLVGRYLGSFRGPDQLSIGVTLKAGAPWLYEILVEELPGLGDGHEGYVVVGQASDVSAIHGGAALEATYLPLPDGVTPAAGKLIRLDRSTPLYATRFSLDLGLESNVEEFPWQHAEGLIPPERSLRTSNCWYYQERRCASGASCPDFYLILCWAEVL